MFVNRTHGVVATTLGVLALGACANPEQNTDLRPEGPPDVLAVLVMTDAASHLQEQATYCRPNDPKRPSLVGLPDATTSQICPADGSAVTDDVADAYPDGWYVRVMFDELLDPSVEELVTIDDETSSGTIANTHPVELKCQNTAGQLVDVAYDGYYSPAGNNVTWPLGPGLVIKPLEPRSIATGQECQVTLNDNITDKDGKPVPADERGPYKFKLAPITVIATDPTDSGDAMKPVAVDAADIAGGGFTFQFNTDVDLSTLCPDTDATGTPGKGKCDGDTSPFSITPKAIGVCSKSTDNTDPAKPKPILCQTAADCPLMTGEHCDWSAGIPVSGISPDDQIVIAPILPVETEKTYTFALTGGKMLKDRCGVATTLDESTAANLQSITFKTNPFDFIKFNIGDGETSAPNKKPTLTFTNAIDVSTLEDTEYTLTPAPGTPAVDSFDGNDAIYFGNYALDTQYTLTIKKGATVKDVFGKQWTNDADKVIHWKTAPKALLSSATADATVFQKIVTVQSVGPSLTWNDNMDISSLGTTEWSLVNAATMQPVAGITAALGSAVTGATCGPDSLSCQFRFRSDFAPGDYIFTLKAGATVNDFLGNTYTQATDRVIHFTVKAPVPAVKCL